YTEAGFKKTGSDTISPPSAIPTLQQVLDAGNTAIGDIYLTQPDDWRPDMELTNSGLMVSRQSDGNSSRQDIDGFDIQNNVEGYFLAVRWQSIEFFNLQETART